MKTTAQQPSATGRMSHRVRQDSLLPPPGLFSGLPALPISGQHSSIQQRVARGERASLVEILDAAIEVVEGFDHHCNSASALDVDGSERSEDDGKDHAPSKSSKQ